MKGNECLLKFTKYAHLNIVTAKKLLYYLQSRSYLQANVLLLHPFYFSYGYVTKCSKYNKRVYNISLGFNCIS